MRSKKWGKLHEAPNGLSPVGVKDERATGVRGELVSPEFALVREDEGQSPAKVAGLCPANSHGGRPP